MTFFDNQNILQGEIIENNVYEHKWKNNIEVAYLNGLLEVNHNLCVLYENTELPIRKTYAQS